MLEIEFVGYLLMQTCYKPLTKRIKAILKMALPKTMKQVHVFNGTINVIKVSKDSQTHQKSHKERNGI